MTKELKFHHPKFEEVVRQELLIFDRPITRNDALNVFDLDCSEFEFDIRDYQTLAAFKNIDWLNIKISANEIVFLNELHFLEELRIEIWNGSASVDFNQFTNFDHLKSLTISGNCSLESEVKNLDGLAKIKALESIALIEFGVVDLNPLSSMPWLKCVYCSKINEICNIEVVSKFSGLEALTLIDVKIDSLDFLDAFPDTLVLGLYGVSVKNGIEHCKLSRFCEGEFDEIEGLYWNDINI